MKRFKSYITLLLFLLSIASTAQIEYSFFNRISSGHIERANSSPDSTRHFGIQPWRLDEFQEAKAYSFIDSARFYYILGTKVLRDHLIKIEKEDILLTLDPLVNFSYSYDFADTTDYRNQKNLIRNTRGFVIQGKIGKDVSFRSSFLENQAFLPLYLKQYVDATGVVPGQGRSKEFGDIGFDFAYSTGYVNWRPIEWLDLQLGQGKAFIGHGYRSLILSDGAFNRPYIRVTSTFLDNKLKYTYNYADLQSLERLPKGEVPESLFKRKGYSWQYLSYSPIPQLEVGAFSSVVWQKRDSTQVLPFNYLALNPVPLSNLGFLGWDDANNFACGFNVRYKATDWLHLYSQALLDDPDQGRTGWQFGLKGFDLLPGLDVLGEVNSIEKSTYGSTTNLQNVVHFNQSVGHPGGSGLMEYLGELRYQYRRFMIMVRYNYIERKIGVNSDITAALLSSEQLESIDVGPDQIARVNMLDARLMFLLNPNTNLRLELGLVDRLDRFEDFKRKSQILSISLKTSIFNEYYDF